MARQLLVGREGGPESVANNVLVSAAATQMQKAFMSSQAQYWHRDALFLAYCSSWARVCTAPEAEGRGLVAGVGVGCVCALFAATSTCSGSATLRATLWSRPARHLLPARPPAQPRFCTLI